VEISSNLFTFQIESIEDLKGVESKNQKTKNKKRKDAAKKTSDSLNSYASFLEEKVKQQDPFHFFLIFFIFHYLLIH